MLFHAGQINALKGFLDQNEVLKEEIREQFEAHSQTEMFRQNIRQKAKEQIENDISLSRIKEEALKKLYGVYQEQSFNKIRHLKNLTSADHKFLNARRDALDRLERRQHNKLPPEELTLEVVLHAMCLYLPEQAEEVKKEFIQNKISALEQDEERLIEYIASTPSLCEYVTNYDLYQHIQSQERRDI